MRDLIDKEAAAREMERCFREGINPEKWPDHIRVMLPPPLDSDVEGLVAWLGYGPTTRVGVNELLRKAMLMIEAQAAELARLRGRLADVEAAIDSIETSHGLTDHGNLWRWWREQCRKCLAKRDEAMSRANAAEARATQLHKRLEDMGAKL